MKLIGETLNIEQLSSNEKKEMFSLYRSFFDFADETVFEHDLIEKDWVILLRDKNNYEIQGFSTQSMLTAREKNKKIRALFSGDTIIHKDYWGEWELIRQWGRLALSVIQAHGADELYWFLICMGYKTYRFLPVFFKDFYPCYNKPTPKSMKKNIELFATAKFKSQFDPKKGIIRLNGNRVALKEGLADIRPNLMNNAHIRYFSRMNPGHSNGDELACIAKLSMENFKWSANRIAKFDDFTPMGFNRISKESDFEGTIRIAQ